MATKEDVTRAVLNADVIPVVSRLAKPGNTNPTWPLASYVRWTGEWILRTEDQVKALTRMVAAQGKQLDVLVAALERQGGAK